MKFFLDENIPLSVKSYLEKEGFEVFDIRGTEREGSPDEIIFNFAQEKQAVFLTTDKDFFHTIPFIHPKHFGIIVIALKKPNRNSILNKTQKFLKTHDMNDVYSKVILITEHNIKVSHS
jgi:predicted nuclease of predicted toxin-antitoxin system